MPGRQAGQQLRCMGVVNREALTVSRNQDLKPHRLSHCGATWLDGHWWDPSGIHVHGLMHV